MRRQGLNRYSLVSKARRPCEQRGSTRDHRQRDATAASVDRAGAATGRDGAAGAVVHPDAVPQQPAAVRADLRDRLGRRGRAGRHRVAVQPGVGRAVSWIAGGRVGPVGHQGGADHARARRPHGARPATAGAHRRVGGDARGRHRQPAPLPRPRDLQERQRRGPAQARRTRRRLSGRRLLRPAAAAGQLRRVRCSSRTGSWSTGSARSAPAARWSRCTRPVTPPGTCASTTATATWC